jgi:hypothetical protein
MGIDKTTDEKSNKLYWLVWRQIWANVSGTLMLTHALDDENTKLLLEQQSKQENLDGNNAKQEIWQARIEQRNYHQNRNLDGD